MNKTMTNQEVFNKVRDHLLSQGEKAMAGKLQDCVYRAPNGKKCAIGCLIPDELYARIIERSAVSEIGIGHQTNGVLALLQALIDAGIDSASFELMEDLQHLHDVGEVDQWSSGLIKIAKRYKLKP